MRKLIVTEFITLDGVIEDPGGSSDWEHGGWSFKFGSDEKRNRYKFDELMEAEAQLLGRVQYEEFAQAWPTMQDEAGFADKMNSMPKYVVSSTLTDPQWKNTTVLSGDMADSVRELKDGDGGPILVAGSATLVRGLLTEGLVDELRLMVFPTTVGGGKRIFPDDRALDLELTRLEQLDHGVLVLEYGPVESE